MTRLNLMLFCALIFSSLGLVNAQHKARKLYIELEQINQQAKQSDQEYGQLQLEQSTWAMHSRVEMIAAQQLQMQVPGLSVCKWLQLKVQLASKSMLKKMPMEQRNNGNEYANCGEATSMASTSIIGGCLVRLCCFIRARHLFAKLP